MNLTQEQVNGQGLEVNTGELKKAALVIRAVNHQLRQQILSLIHQSGRIKVTDVYKKLDLEQSVASQHLAILRRAGFVNTQREGKLIFYSINVERFDELNDMISRLLH